MARKQQSDTDKLKLPPQDIEAEQSVLGGIMIDKNAITKVADILVAEDFYRPNDQKIYETMLELFSKSQPIDILTVSSRLKEKEQLEEVGGISYLTELINAVPTSSHIAHYAKIVNKKRVLRELLAASYEIGELASHEEKETQDILDEAEQKIFAVFQRIVINAFQHIKQGLKQAFERIDMLHKQKGQLRGVPTGFKALDNILAGLQKSDLVILASRPSLGKSSLALDIARNAATKHKIPVGLFTLEMSRDQVIDRLIAAEANVPLWKIRTGKLSEEGSPNDFELIQEAMARLDEAPIYIDDTASPTVIQIRAMARRLKAESGLGLLIIDYLQLILPSTNTNNIVQQVTEISRSLKGLAKELNVPVLALSQLNRAVEQRPNQIPRLSDLRESGAIEQDADVVMLIYREDRVREDSSRENMADIIVAKHRNGPLGKATIMFVEQYVSFRDLADERYIGSDEAELEPGGEL
ncbi:MAG: replicative DNA helicase [Candidatus Brennerbacteria bacterium CG11_big_fil_rev_8_21_14_0_20_43_10]|uniref:Replicative DNA helicase n=3 Tax=Candidatus Brenneribacteriota TaxID=1817902 RepID=A0A2M8C3G2_9BACT|nr:MAG: replicative DNA helicase [Parcubacteria group bacterium CG1_02_44_31]PIP50418.1 MAG: replicative DNA helicase [Candidatus Brennerbacteria bacterium CG23_combo_of_CG06-09_8_20_14_all_44_41]PIR26783.1 MAG: replicative DNA helicase [Candidatus Brennerbacteria bacterium CG11_big_fil_rev_8_21_14_0_20_43_10]PIX29054.1 MAG: replicative DNA helicase [Candidatus Brennerbacteria bacterium CG_4_8_14_3_um_filter_43_14]PJA18931.1 MAG: replicative DNA helicase [Candidatus Brennerbacteria bacterium CG